MAFTGNHVSLSFIEFSIPATTNCTTDYLEIRTVNSTGRLLGYFCGNEPPNNLTNIGDIWVLFKSSKLQPGDDPVEAIGFLAEFTLSKSYRSNLPKIQGHKQYGLD